MSTAPASRSSSAWTVATVMGVPLRVGPSWLVMAAVIAVTLAPVAPRFSPGISTPGAYAVGLLFAVLLAASIVLHELSHAVVAARLGMPVHGITLHFLGGVTQVGEESRTPGREFAVAVVGPLTSIAVGLLALGAQRLLQAEGLLLLVLGGLAAVNLFVGVFNLVPGLPLDGGRLLRAAVWKATGDGDRGLLVAGLSGRGVAALAVAVPLVLLLAGRVGPLDLVIAAVVALFLWQGSGAAVSVARWRLRMPTLRAGELGRRCLVVAATDSLAEVLDRVRAEGAGAVVVTDAAGIPTGVLSEEAVRATPDGAQDLLSAADVSRHLEPGLRLDAALEGMDLLRALQDAPATEYVVMHEGRVHGVLVAADVEKLLRES